MKKLIVAAASSALLLAGIGRAPVDAQVGYARGQDISPTFDGWEQNPDGSYTLYFGYFNRNLGEELDVPVGPDNSFDLGGDRGTIVLGGGKDAVHFRGHYGAVTGLWFTPDGTKLISCSVDAQILMWDVPENA